MVDGRKVWLLSLNEAITTVRGARVESFSTPDSTARAGDGRLRTESGSWLKDRMKLYTGE